MRSHAHTARLAQKNKAPIPALVCSWPEGDEADPPLNDKVDQAKVAAPPAGPERKRSGEGKKVKGPLKTRNLEREKEIRRDEDRDSLLARIGTSIPHICSRRRHTDG